MALSGISLNAVTATGAGSAIVFDTPQTAVSLQVKSTGGPSFSVSLEVSVDGANFVVPNSTTALAVDGITEMIWGNGTPVVPVVAARANLTSLSGGTSPTISASVAGSGR